MTKLIFLNCSIKFADNILFEQTMTAIITFVIPVRHPDNCHNWAKLKSNLTQTLASISNQTNPHWRAIIVANRAAELPVHSDLRIEVAYVDFPPNALYKKNNLTDALFFDATRLDKGKRVMAGVMAFIDTHYYMVVDDDDLINNQLVEFVSHQPHICGWKVKEGYVWDDGGKLLLINRDFHHLCGTSLIIRADLYLPQKLDEVSEEEIKTIYGSHITIVDYLLKKGLTLQSIPFKAAIYRVGYAGSHSLAPTLTKRIFNKKMFFRPVRFFLHVLNLRFVTPHIKNAFF